MTDEVTIAAEEQTGTDTTGLEELRTELARLKEENSKLKSAQSNASADASKYKKQLQERMSEQERAANETKELIERLKAENAEMKKNQMLAEYTSGFMGLGFESALAKKAAEATADGNFSAMTAAIKDFIEAREKAIKADALRSTPRPGTGAVAPEITKEEFEKMGYSERLKIFNEQPDLYKELIK